MSGVTRTTEKILIIRTKFYSEVLVFLNEIYRVFIASQQSILSFVLVETVIKVGQKSVRMAFIS